MQADDYFAIQNLIHRYPLHLDRGEIDEMAELFRHADVYMGDLPPVRCDPAAVAQAFRGFLRLYDDGAGRLVPRTRHMTSNVIIESDGEGRARASSYVMVFQQALELPLQPIIGGDYRDRFEKVEGAWRFVERRIGNDLYGNLSAHGKYALT